MNSAIKSVGLCLNGYPRVVLDVELAKLDCPLYHSPCCFRLVYGLLDGLISHHHDGVRLKVWSQFARSYYQRECNLFNLWVLGFCTLKSLTDLLNWSCFLSSSRIKAALTAMADTAKYKYKFTPSLDRLKKGRLLK